MMTEISGFSVKSVKLLSSTNPELKEIDLNYPVRDPDAGPAGFVSLQIEETMYSPTIYGEMVLRDFDSSEKQFVPALFSNENDGLVGLGGYDILRILLSKDGEAGIEFSVDLMIYAYSQETSETKSVVEPATNPRLIKLRLASPEFALMDYAFMEYFENEKDMIRPISKIAQEGQENANTGEFIAGLETSTAQEGREYNGEGLIQYLIQRLGDKLKESIAGYSPAPLFSEDTKNWVWLKKKYNYYPWGKPIVAPRVSQLTQFLAENSVHKDWDRGTKAANFFFWRTLDSWNFFSIETLVKQNPYKVYTVSSDLSQEESIRTLISGKIDEGVMTFHDETDFLSLLEAKAFGAHYLFIEPKYSEDPYARYLDTNEGHVIKEIQYDYLKDGTSWSKLPQTDIKQTPIIGTSIQKYKDKSILAELPKNRLTMGNYGYFSEGLYNKNKTVPWEYYGYPHSSRGEKTNWQSQFDITDLSGQQLLWIQKEIKEKLQEKRQEYAKKKNLKEKWKVYKCSICCSGLSETSGETANQETTTQQTEQAGLITQEGANEINTLGLGPFAGLEQSATTSTGPTEVTFSDGRFLASFNLRSEAAKNLSNYEIAAAGSFTDAINFDFNSFYSGSSGASGSLDLTDPFVRSGMTLSYNLNESPYNMTIGEFMNLQENPDNFIRYRFDLEILRHEKLKTILQNNIIARQTRIKSYQELSKDYENAYIGRNDICLENQCEGYCKCPTEYPETVKSKTSLVSSGHDVLAKHEEALLNQIDPVIERLKTLKNEFERLYKIFWSRKAFFYSKNIDFSFLSSGNNLFNIKSIKRIPIKDSKYAPFAIRKSLSISGASGASGASGSSGASANCSYPYEVYFGQKELSGGSGGNAICGITSNAYYSRTYGEAEKSDFWYSFGTTLGSVFSNLPYSEPNIEKPKGPIWYRNWLVSYEITVIKPPCLNKQPPCQQTDCTCDEIVIPLDMHFESFANAPVADVLVNNTKVQEYALAELSKNCDGCKIRIISALPSSDIKLYHPWAADELKDSNGDELGFTLGNYIDYQKSASLFDDRLENKVPPHLMLEGTESYVRIEFKTPIGLGTLQDFPEGFIDTYGSEYFLPYIVLLTAGPFGAEAARTNVSVIGQDPYGFDVAVKKIKNRDDFSGMNLMMPGISGDDYSDFYSETSPFSTSSSWLRHSQNSLFYKPVDGIADLFVPSGIQDIFKASALERSFPVKSWWDMWISLPPIAVATFYNRWDVLGASGGSMQKLIDADNAPPGIAEGMTFQSIAFYFNNSIVAEPFSWTGDTGCNFVQSPGQPSNPGPGCIANGDIPWPLFLHPDTEQIITGVFPSDSAVIPLSTSLESSSYLGRFNAELNPAYIGSTYGPTLGISGATVGFIGGAYILPSDPSNYVYKFAEFPHIYGISQPSDPGLTSIQGIKKDKEYSVVSYPVGTLIWGQQFPQGKSGSGLPFSGASGQSASSEPDYDYNKVWKYDISRKTQYGLVQLNSDSMPSLISMIGGVGGNLQRIEEYNRWISDKVLDWYQNTIFDNNFSAQFVVLSNEGVGSCGKEYPCMNPAGFPGIAGCPPEDPLCNCPCQGTDDNKGKKLSEYVEPGGTMPDELILRPDLMDMVVDRFVGVTPADPASFGKEPSNLEIKLLESQITECELVKSHPKLGESYLGCVWDEPECPYNCTCPTIGKNFPDYMKYSRTTATFWDTPLETPLYRNAQMALLNSNKIKIRVAGDLALATGAVVEIKASTDKPKRFSGRWIVTSLNHLFNPDYHMMDISLSRELPHPNEKKEDN